ncbi:MAG: hypothetical protein QNJ09_12105, partial [Paracoccaceae bacterium]|nr:hypothetical protein [Paracoccaceae bacterium]
MNRPEMKMKAPRITKRDALPEGLDFEALMKAGLNQARRFSGDTWTDFNVHDPGVTILEQLCFSLSDVAYRISHPIEDILETPLPQSVVRGLKGKVSPDTEPKRVEQNFPTGDRILTTAPVTEGDLRASICDCEPDIRNAWIADVDGQSDPEGGPVTGLFDVHLQLFSDVSADSISEERHQEIENAVRQRVGQLRLLATDVRDVKVLPSRRVTIHAEIEGEDDEAEHTHSSVLVARILHSLQMKLNPPAKFVNPDALRAAGIPLDEILDGPALSHGVVASGIAPRPTMNVSAQQTREWIRDVDGVKRIISLRLDPENEDEGVPFFDTSPGAIGCIRVHQNGNRAFDPLDMQGTDLQELRALDSNPRTRSQAPAAEGGPFESSIESVGASLKHRVELIHAEREKTRIGWTASDYKRVPRGRPRKTLGRYRSVQHTFPAIYGLTSNGGSIVQGVRAPSPDEIAQMRGFLALFEQQVANLL